MEDRKVSQGGCRLTKGLDVFGKKKRKKFYRKMFHDVERSVEEVGLVVVTGPRQVGKTVMLRQLQERHGGDYFNFKVLTEDEQDAVLLEIRESFLGTGERYFYLDEITYLDDFGRKLAAIADAYVMGLGRDSSVKIAITGSQEVAIRGAGYAAFGGRARYYHVPFLSFLEYLVYEGKLPGYPEDLSFYSFGSVKDFVGSVVESDYYDFLLNFRFSGSNVSNIDYVNGCIAETVNSNAKESWADPSSFISDLDLGDVFAVLYTVLLKLHDAIAARNIGDYEFLLKKVRTYYNQNRKREKILKRDFQDAVRNTFLSGYQKSRHLKFSEFVNIIRFLYQCSFISITAFSFQDVNGLKSMLRTGTTNVGDMDEFFARFNVTINCPEFFVNVLEELASVLKVDTGDLLTRPLVGSILECSLKGGLACAFGHPLLELRQYDDITLNVVGEVDYVDGRHAIEFSVRDKPITQTHFNKFPQIDGCRKILLGEHVCCIQDGVERIPYYVFEAVLGTLI